MGEPLIAPTAEGKAQYANCIFSGIARRYDLANRLLTFGLVRGWYRSVASLAALPPGGRGLDVGTGTGELALALAQASPESYVVGLDFCSEMLEIAQRRMKASSLGAQSDLMVGDALRLPFPDDVFHRVTTGFVLRNVASLPQAVGEMRRVVVPGGRIVCLELSNSQPPGFRHIHRLYFHYVVPLLGGVITGQGEAYRYLIYSLNHFPSPEGLKGIMEEAGLREVSYRMLSLGIVTVHMGVK